MKAAGVYGALWMLIAALFVLIVFAESLVGRSDE